MAGERTVSVAHRAVTVPSTVYFDQVTSITYTTSYPECETAERKKERKKIAQVKSVRKKKTEGKMEQQGEWQLPPGDNYNSKATIRG